MAGSKLLIYFLRRDLRVADNPILHHLSSSRDHGFTHLLPIFVFPSHQIEVSGFVKDGEKSPYPPARSQVGNFWRCGPHRAKFIAQSVWDVKNTLKELNSDLVLRAGAPTDVLKHLLQSFEGKESPVGGVWMTREESSEEVQEQDALADICSSKGIEFKLWKDEKYLIDDRDTGLSKPQDLPDVFTTYRKQQEPLRERPRPVLAKPGNGQLLPLPQSIPVSDEPFIIPDTLEDLEARLLRPLDDIIKDAPPFPESASSAHPFTGGETKAMERVTHLIESGGMTNYKDTRNGLIGPDFSTKLSAYLALGCISARQVHDELVKFEDGKEAVYAEGQGYGEGENEGTRAMRFELLWRDYMRLCTQKFGKHLFMLSGFKQDASYDKKWKTPKPSKLDREAPPDRISHIIDRFLKGTTGMGLIDASQRELLHTGYTSNRARQNVASFFSKHLGIDWRYGAEWYEMNLVDYDVSSNWANWQYVAGVGNDPRGDARIFNPVKQAFDYDKDGSYVRNWVPEVKNFDKFENVFQICTASKEDLDKNGMADNIMVKDPLKRIEFSVDRKPRGNRRSYAKRRGYGRGGRRGGGSGQGGEGSHNGSNSTPSSGENVNGGHKKGQHNGYHGGHGRGGRSRQAGRPNNYQASYSGNENYGYWNSGYQSAGQGMYYGGMNRGYGSRGGFRGGYSAPYDMQIHAQHFPQLPHMGYQG